MHQKTFEKFGAVAVGVESVTEVNEAKHIWLLFGKKLKGHFT